MDNNATNHTIIRAQKSAQTSSEMGGRQGSYPPSPHFRITHPHMDPLLIEAAKNNNETRVRRLLSDGADPDAADIHGETALTWAAHLGHTAIVKDLLAANANREARGNLFQATPLLLAARGAHRGIVALLATLSDVDARTDRGATALMLAVEKPPEDRVKPPHRVHGIIQTLLEAGADPNLQDEGGNTALMWAVYGRDPGAISLLAWAGADLELENERGETALWIADARGNTEMVDLLHALGARK